MLIEAAVSVIAAVRMVAGVAMAGASATVALPAATLLLLMLQYAAKPFRVYEEPRASARVMLPPSEVQPARWAEVRLRQAAELALILARTTPCCVERGLTGIARDRRYWPKRLCDAVVPAWEPDDGWPRYFMQGDGSST